MLNTNYDESDVGILTTRVGMLTNDFFVNLTDTDLVWEKAHADGLSFVLKDRASGIRKFKASRNDLVFGSNAQLRAISDVYASKDGHPRFVKDFIKVWDKVMMLDRYDVKGHRRTAPMAS